MSENHKTKGEETPATRFSKLRSQADDNGENYLKAMRIAAPNAKDKFDVKQGTNIFETENGALKGLTVRDARRFDTLAQADIAIRQVLMTCHHLIPPLPTGSEANYYKATASADEALLKLGEECRAMGRRAEKLVKEDILDKYDSAINAVKASKNAEERSKLCQYIIQHNLTRFSIGKKSGGLLVEEIDFAHYILKPKQASNKDAVVKKSAPTTKLRKAVVKKEVQVNA